MGGTDEAVEAAADVLWEFQNVLSARLDILLQWSNEHACRLPECDLGLVRTPLGYKLVATFLGGPPMGEEMTANEQGLVVRGHRVLKRGTSHEVQRFALHSARYGVRGGPAYDDGPLRWCPIALDGSLRMAVPGGELRITPLTAGATVIGAPEAACLLTFEDVRRIYPITLATGAELRHDGVELWQQQKARHALQIRLSGKCVDLRSAGLPGVLGYHAVAERTFIVLAWVCGEIGLFYLDGYEFTLLARLEMGDLRHGEPLDVELLMRSRANRGVANQGPKVFTAEEVVPVMLVDAPMAGPMREPPVVEPSVDPRLVSGERMSTWHRELCVRHLSRLRASLKGRGARKARLLVGLLLEALDQCRRDLVGTRTEVHAALVGLLGRDMPGGDRNIRDCLDLLCRETPIFSKDEHRCTILLAQLHDVNSGLIRRIAELEREALRDLPAPRLVPTPEASPIDQERLRAETAPVGNADGSQDSSVRGNIIVASEPTRVGPDGMVPNGVCSEPVVRDPDAWIDDRGCYRQLGLGDSSVSMEAHTSDPGDTPPGQDRPRSPAPDPIPSPTASLLGFTRPWRPEFDDPYDPFDPEVETINSPSRMFLMSRQKSAKS